MAAGVVVSNIVKLIFPTSAGGAGSFFRSVRRRGVAGKGNGGILRRDRGCPADECN